jgi:hypothetical protein
LEQLRGDDYQPEVATEIVDAHLRSLEQGHMTGIASNDEETGPKPAPQESWPFWGQEDVNRRN